MKVYQIFTKKYFSGKCQTTGHEMTLSAMFKASGPLTLITEIAPVPGTVAGAHIVSSFFIYIYVVLCCKISNLICRYDLILPIFV